MPYPTNSMFENMQKTVFATAGTVFGHVLTWTPSAGDDEITAKVLFQNPTESMKLAGIDYDPTLWRMEYSYEQLPGLKAAVDARGGAETVTIEGVDYYVRVVDTKYDGKTYIAQLQPV